MLYLLQYESITAAYREPKFKIGQKVVCVKSSIDSDDAPVLILNREYEIADCKRSSPDRSFHMRYVYQLKGMPFVDGRGQEIWYTEKRFISSVEYNSRKFDL